MFELSVAYKYLIPRWRQLSVSIISIISILVIALVVWLILVFFSVSNGLEKIWMEKLTSLTAPIRITPTDAYYQSYYHQIDSISENSQYQSKSIREKREAQLTDPYNPDIDEEIPVHWMEADRNPDGSLKDLVKEAFAAVNTIKAVPGLTSNDFEMTFGNLRLRVIRPAAGMEVGQKARANHGFMTQGVYLGSFDSHNATLQKTLLDIMPGDVANLLENLSVSNEGIQEESGEDIKLVSKQERDKRLKTLLDHLEITHLKTPQAGWVIPQKLYPKNGSIKIAVLMHKGKVSRLIVPQNVSDLSTLTSFWIGQGYEVKKGTLQFPQVSIILEGEDSPLSLQKIPLMLDGEVSFPAHLSSMTLIGRSYRDLPFEVALMIQGISFSGKIPLGFLEIDKIKVSKNYTEIPKTTPFWIHGITNNSQTTWVLPSDPKNGEGILLPRTFREAGVFLGDQGFLSYYSPTTSSMQEQRIPVYVAGFFDHGVMPMGSKFVVINPAIATLIRSSYQQGDQGSHTGIHVRFDDLNQAQDVKVALQDEFEKRGIDRYWQIETYQEYEFTKDLIQQLRSEKNLFTLISVVIIIVACSNIISMLIILVNDKKMEIGILRAMGATSKSIAAIFGLCGLIMGAIGSLIGIGFAWFTLKNLHLLLDFIGKIQGHKVFSAMYFGDVLPNELSYEALGFVMAATVLISLFAGIVPAAKACMLRPSAILRSE